MMFCALTWVLLSVATLQLVATPSSLDTQAFVSALQQHKWMIAGATGIYLLVAFLKQGWAGAKLQALLPPRAIPFVAPLLGILAVASAELVGGTTWPTALLDGVGAGVLAVFGHQAIVEGARAGKEIVPEKPGPLPPAASSA
jgi:hypothetical protein